MEVSTVRRGIAAEKILFLCQRDVPEGDSEDYSLLTPASTWFFPPFSLSFLHAEALRWWQAHQNSREDVTDGRLEAHRF